MARVYLANAFSLSMLPLGEGETGQVCVRRLSIDGFTYWVAKARLDGLLDCAVGHSSTARLVEELLGLPAGSLGCQRKMIALQPGDSVVVVQLSFRLPEGKVLSYDEMVQLLRDGKIAFYAVHYGPC